MKLIVCLFSILFILSITQAAFSKEATEEKQSTMVMPGSDRMFNPQPEPPGEPWMVAAVKPETPAQPPKRIPVPGPVSIPAEKGIIIDNGIQFIPAKAGEKAGLLLDGKPYVPAPGMDTGAAAKGIIIVGSKPGGDLQARGIIVVNGQPYAPTSNVNAPGVFMILGKAYVPAGETADEPLWKSKAEQK